MKRFLSAPLLLAASFLCSVGFAQVPTWTVINSGLDSVFGNAGKSVLDPQTAGLSGVAFGNNTFVVTAASVSETVLRWATSPDGLTWTAHSQNLPSGYKSGGESRIHFLNGKFVFFAAHSNNGFAEQWVYTSADGASFTGAKMASGSPGYAEFDSNGSTTVVAGANGNQLTSTDNLATWVASPVASGLYSHNDLAYGNGRFISTINGFGGAAYTSADGLSWTQIPNLSTPGGGFVEFGNGFFVAQVGGEKYKSTDGVNFSKITSTINASGWLGIGGDLHYAGGRFVVTSTDLNSGKTGFIGSSDCLTWTPICYLPAAPAPTSGFISRGYGYADLAYGNGKYVFVGTDTQQAAFSIQKTPLIIVGDASAAPTPPTINTQPQASNAVIGGTATFSVSVAGTGLTFQWYFNGAAIAGATSATYTIPVVASNHAGSYKVGVTNAAGTTFSAQVTLTLVSGSNAGRITNLSVRSNAGTGSNTLIVGVVIGGTGVSGAKAALVRAIGPTLTDYGVGGVLVDPVMTLFKGSNQVAVNDNWGGDAQIVAVANQVGAFALANTASKDAAFYSATVDSGAYSVQITGTGGTTGVALAEVYDATPTASFTATTPRLINVSARTFVGTGDQVLIAGFVIGGTTAKTVLIRGIGPTLTNYGVGGVLADPKLELYQGSTKISENDNWGNTDALKTAFSTVGAFNLDGASKDAALLVTLQPGVYSAQVTGVGNTTGVGLIEIYEMP